MNRNQRIHRVAFWEQVAESARGKAKELRDELAEEARTELAVTGMAPTWRDRELGTVSLPVSKGGFAVANWQAFTRWVAAHHPDGVETTVSVKPVFLTNLLARVAQDGEGGIVEDVEGVSWPVVGLTYEEGGQPRSLTITVDRAAKAGLRMLADEALDGMFAAAEPAAVAEVASDGA